MGMYSPLAGKGIRMSSDIIVIERELLKSEAFRDLSGAAKTVYLDFRMKCRVKSMKFKGGRKKERVILNNGEIEYCYSEAEKKGITRPRFMRSIDTLVERGLLDIAHSGSGGRKGDKSLYAISDRWQRFGTGNFVPGQRPKDKRGGRGFRKGHQHWKKTSIIGNKNVNPTINENVT